MKKRCYVTWAAGAAVVCTVGVPSMPASDRLQWTVVDLCLNMPEDYNRTASEDMHRRTSLASDWFGPLEGAGYAGTDWFKNPIAYADFKTTLIDGQNDLEGTVFSPGVGFQFQTACELNLGFSYHRTFYDFESFDDTVDGDGDADRFTLFANRQYENGFRIGGAYTYADGDYKLSDSFNNVSGTQDWSYHGATLGLGYSGRCGDIETCENVSYDHSLNLSYAFKSPDHRNGIFQKDYHYHSWWLSSLNRVGHNFNKDLNVYVIGNLHYMFDETDRDDINLFFGNLQSGDNFFGELGAGINYHVGGGMSVNSEVKFPVGYKSNDRPTMQASFSYKF